MTAVSKETRQKTQQERLRRNEQKWTVPLMEAGWSVLPNVILDRQKILKLDPVDVNILLHLVKHWWYADRLPYPSKQTIADCMGVDASTVRRHIAKLEKRNLIQRVARYDKRKGQQSNQYDLTGLIDAARPLAEEMIEIRKSRKKKDAKNRVMRSLRVVTSAEEESDDE